MTLAKIINPLVLACAVLMGGVIALSFALLGDGEPAIRMVLRSSARISFMLFLCVYLASPLAMLAPGPATRWLVARRRSLGLSFALAHFTAGAMVAWFAGRYHADFMAITYPLQRIGGSFGFLAIAYMVATSFDVAKRRLTPRQWKIGHGLCLNFIVINYVVSFSRRTLLNHDLFYAPFFILVMAAIALRVAAAIKSARGRAPRSVAAAG